MSKEFLITIIPAVIMLGFAVFAIMNIIPDVSLVQESSGHLFLKIHTDNSRSISWVISKFLN